MKELIGLDFETYSGCDLLKHGLHQYVNDPTFRPLIAAVVYPSGLSERFDFTGGDEEEQTKRLFDVLDGHIIVAHNAGFEQAVLERMGIDIPSRDFIDSATCARAAGAAGKLEAAAPQLLGLDKLEMGYDLIKLFSIPGPYQEDNDSNHFDPQIVADNPQKWEDFHHYCAVDARLSLRLAQEFPMPDREYQYNAVTMDMNNTGWYVDMDTVKWMHHLYQENVEQAIEHFRTTVRDAEDLNLNSTPQLKMWCAKRGIRTTSFDEKHVASLIKAVNRKRDSLAPEDPKWDEYTEVLMMLACKQLLGGSSLKKLDTIINTIGVDGRLHDQYLHIGAGATFRTTGRGVQMQNLPRLHGGGDDVSDITGWSNSKLSSNLRQVFTASHSDGFLIVGDFSSVESRGLAWQAGEQWKLDAYFKGQDLYKLQAADMFHIPLADVGKEERQVGKVGELSCGYGAGPDAVREFAKNMGVDLSDGEASRLVRDWRAANPKIVEYWYALDAALHSALTTGERQWVPLPHGVVHIIATKSPESLLKQDPDVASLVIHMNAADNTELLTRVIHGCKVVGRNVQYYKPSERKNGDLWLDEFVNPKTKRLQKHTVYGGKLAGLLTQSLCREVFMESMTSVHDWLKHIPNVELVGQFHDEIVLEWTPGGTSLEQTKEVLEICMTNTRLVGFPLAAEIKHDFRYTK